MSAEDVLPPLQPVPLPTLQAVPLPPAPVVSAAPESMPPPVPSSTAPGPVVVPERAPGGAAETFRGETYRSPGTASAAGREPAEHGTDVLGTAVHIAVGAAWWATGPLRLGGRLAKRAAEAAISDARQRSRWLQEQMQDRAGGERGSIELFVQALLRPVISKVVAAALAELDLTDLILDNVDLDTIAAHLDVEAVIARVDLDAVVATVDLDAAVRRVDVDQIVSRIDVDGIVAKVDLDQIVSRIDIDGIVAGVDLDAVVDRIDVDGIVAKVDLDQIVSRIDIDGIVAGVDLDAIVDRLDIAGVVAKVDPDPVVARVNFDAALAKIDMIGLAQEIVDGIDLPGIIRDSTGSLASEAVQGVRVQGQAADDAVGQLVGRVFRRRAAQDGHRPQ